MHREADDPQEGESHRGPETQVIDVVGKTDKGLHRSCQQDGVAHQHTGQLPDQQPDQDDDDIAKSLPSHVFVPRARCRQAHT